MHIIILHQHYVLIYTRKTLYAFLNKMDTYDIQYFMKNIDPSLENNVFAANRIPIKVSLPMYLICNMDPDTKAGSHWVAMCIDSKGVGEFFDSFGRKPDKYQEDFFRKNCKRYVYNTNVIQNYLTSVCGMYSLVYIYCRFKGIKMYDFIKMFTNDTLRNDLLIKNVFERLFL